MVAVNAANFLHTLIIADTLSKLPVSTASTGYTAVA